MSKTTVSTQATQLRYSMRAVAVACVALVLSQAALAGGLDNGTDAVDTTAKWIYRTIGVGSLGYLGWEGVKLWANKIQWPDFGVAALKVFGVGGTGLLSAYLWTLAAK